MDIWIIEDGERVGPIHDFEVRKRIEAGTLSRDSPAWHEGLPEWIPLGEIGLFHHEFARPSKAAEEPAMPTPPPGPLPPLLPANPAIIRRFWARWFDLYLYSGIWWLMMWMAGRDIANALANPWLFLLLYVPWFAIEAGMIHKFATTPGKWLLGLRVFNDDGSLLTLTQAMRRSLRVFFIGIGFGWAPLTLICQLLGYFTTKRIGRTLWDQAGGHRTEADPLGPPRMAGFVFLFFAALYLNMIVLYPHAADQTIESYPAMRKQLEENPPWHLPKKH